MSAAKADLEQIIDWTTEQFGEMQAERYAKMIDDAICLVAPRSIGPWSQDAQ